MKPKLKYNCRMVPLFDNKKFDIVFDVSSEREFKEKLINHYGRYEIIFANRILPNGKEINLPELEKTLIFSGEFLKKNDAGKYEFSKLRSLKKQKK